MGRIAAVLAALGLVMAPMPAAADAPPRLDAATAAARDQCRVWQDISLPWVTRDSPAVRHTPGVARRGRVLRVDGEVFRDIDGAQETDRVRHYYAGRMSALPVDVVVRAPYEGQQWILVDRATGDRATVPDLPRVAPDGHRFVSHGTDHAFGQYGLLLMDWTPHGFVQIARFNVERPCAVEWVGAEELRLQLNLSMEPGGANAPARIVRRDGHWVLLGPGNQVIVAE